MVFHLIGPLKFSWCTTSRYLYLFVPLSFLSLFLTDTLFSSNHFKRPTNQITIWSALFTSNQLYVCIIRLHILMLLIVLLLGICLHCIMLLHLICHHNLVYILLWIRNTLVLFINFLNTFFHQERIFRSNTKWRLSLKWNK